MQPASRNRRWRGLRPIASSQPCHSWHGYSRLPIGELRTRLEDYDDHDDVLDTRRARKSAVERRRVRAAQDRFAIAGQAN